MSNGQEIERSGNLREKATQKALMAGVPGLILFIIGFLMVFVYPGELGRGIAFVIFGAGIVGVAAAIYFVVQMRTITEFSIKCPFCSGKNTFLQSPQSDVRCVSCDRQIPIDNGKILAVDEVRCGFCNTLNWYNEKTVGLFCESCGRVIPISVDEGEEGVFALEKFGLQDDNTKYDIYLGKDHQNKEALIGELQRLLSTNRAVVKDLMDAAPVKILEGVPRRKAERIAKDIMDVGGYAEIEPTQDA
jgi:ribosomal protein L7/L12/ribosomal protein S27E